MKFFLKLTISASKHIKCVQENHILKVLRLLQMTYKKSLHIKISKLFLTTFLFYWVFCRPTVKASKPPKCDFHEHILGVLRHFWSISKKFHKIWKIANFLVTFSYFMHCLLKLLNKGHSCKKHVFFRNFLQFWHIINF